MSYKKATSLSPRERLGNTIEEFQDEEDEDDEDPQQDGNQYLKPYLEEESAYENQYLNLRDLEVEKTIKQGKYSGRVSDVRSTYNRNTGSPTENNVSSRR